MTWPVRFRWLETYTYSSLLGIINTHYNLVKVRRDLFFFERKILYPKLWLLQGSQPTIRSIKTQEMLDTIFNYVLT